jgi:hypothetical protein
MHRFQGYFFDLTNLTSGTSNFDLTPKRNCGVMLKYGKKYNTIKISETREEVKNENYEILKKFGLRDKMKGLL